MKGVNAQAAAMQGTMGRVAGSAHRVLNPYNQLNESLYRNKIGMKELAMVARDANGVWAHNQRLMRATGEVTYDAAGNARVMVNQMGHLNKATTGVGGQIRTFNTYLQKGSSSLVKWGKNTQWAGRQLMIGFTLPLALFGRAAAKAAEEYDKEMTKIVKVTKFTAEEGTRAFEMQVESVERQTEAIVDLGASMGFAAQETSSTIAEFAQMGYIGRQLDVLSDAALKFSRISGTELSTSIDLTRITAQAFDTDLQNLSGTFAKLNLIENNTALSMEELADSIPVVAGVAANLGMEIETTAGLMAIMKENGIAAREGATALRTGLVRIVQEATDPAQEAFQGIGLDLIEMQKRMNEVEGGDVMWFLEELGGHLNNLQKQGPGAQGQINEFVGAMGKLVGTRQAARFLALLGDIPDITKEGTVAQRAFLGATTEVQEAMRIYNFELERVQESAAGVAERLRAELNVEMARLGESFLEVMNRAMTVARNILRWFNDLNDGTRRTVLSMLGLIGVLGPLIMFSGLLANAMGNVLRVFTKFLPKSAALTVAERAQAIAFEENAMAIGTADAALNKHIATMARYQAAAGGATAANQVFSTGMADDAAVAAGAGLGPHMLDPARDAGRARTGGMGVGSALSGGIFGRSATKAGKEISEEVLTMPQKIGRGLKGLPKAFGAKLQAVLLIIPNLLSKMMGKGGMMGKIGTAGMMGGGLAVKAGAALKTAGAALLGPWGAIAAIIAGIPILADPQAFFESFKNAVGPTFDRVKESLSAIGSAFGRIREIISDMSGGEGGNSGLSKLASILGSIAGIVGNILLGAFNLVLNVVRAIMPAIEAVMFLLEAIGDVLSGDWEGAGNAIMEMFRAIGRAILEIIATVMDLVADVLDAIPGLGWAADAIRRAADGVRNWSAMQSHVSAEVSKTEQAYRDMVAAQDELASSIEEGVKFEQELIAEKIIESEMTVEEIKNHRMLTDEMKYRLVLLRKQQEMELEFEAARMELEAVRMEQEQRGFAARTASDRTRAELERVAVSQLSARERWLLKEARVKDRMNLLTGKQSSLEEDIAKSLGLQVNEAGELVDEQGEALETQEELNKEMESFVNTWVSSLRGEVSNVQSEIADAVMQSLSDEQDAVMDGFSSRMDAIKAEFDARKEALRNRTDAEKEALQETQESRLDRVEEQHEIEMTRLQERREAQRDAIEGQKEQENELERQRERAFEREKARIDYLTGKRTGNIEMQLALARGELSQAAIIRERLSSEGRNFRIDAVERERGYTMEDRDRARQARLERFDEETKRQEEALQEQQDMYTETLEKQNKAQEKALDMRHRNLEKSLEREEQIAEKRVEAEKNAAEEGFEARERAIKNTLKEWERVNPRTEKEYREHLNVLRQDLKKHGMPGGHWSKIVDRFADNTASNIGGGFKRAERIARKALGQDAKWDNLAAGMVQDFAAGLTAGISKEFRELADMFGVRIPDPPKRKTTNPNAQGVGGRRGGIPERAHSGRYIDRSTNEPGLRPDEAKFILQRGEYVVQRDAVKALGVDYLEQLNRAHKINRPTDNDAGRYHSGGEVDWQKKIDKGRGVRGSGKLVGRFLSYLANHGGVPGGYGARGVGNMESVADLIPPDSDATWRMPGGWKQGLDPRVARITASILNSVPGGQRITSAFRPGATVLGTGRRSQHSTGMAVDIGARSRRAGGTIEEERIGDMLANAFRNHPAAHQVIWKSMTGGNHYDHVHAGFRFHDGGLVEQQPDFSGMNFGKNDFMSAIAGKFLGSFSNMLADSMGAYMPTQGPGPTPSGPIQKYAREMLANYGWPDSMWSDVDQLVSHESSWRPTAQNPRSTAYGLFQFLDATWGGVGGRKTSDPYEQIRYGYKYIQNRYGNPARAWDFWQRNHWYHGGGEVQIPSLARGADINYDNVLTNLHKGERVLTSDLTQKLDLGLDRMASGDSFGDTHIHIGEFHGTEENLERLVEKIEKVQQKREKRRGAKRRFG